MVMERSEFEQSLAQATRTAIEAARAVVLDDLSESARYWAGIGFEEGRGPAPDGDVIRKELALPGDDVRGPWTADQVVDFFWVAGTVPIWIDIRVGDCNDDHTFLWLGGSVVFTARMERMRLADGCPQPFGVLRPSAPTRDWARGKKFALRASPSFLGTEADPGCILNDHG